MRKLTKEEKQTRVDAAVKKRAAEVLKKMNLTVSDAVRILLTRVANEGGLTAGFTTDRDIHDAWFRAKVQEALADPRLSVPYDQVENHFTARRAAALRKADVCPCFIPYRGHGLFLHYHRTCRSGPYPRFVFSGKGNRENQLVNLEA
ncbi:type II toxin-antitoxin system RelB/DinJ family antitoxin [Desulfobulbus alkaliphilus]|nr:type II toxin-antitoxin system RelB/DinJ family antitoxin [Desulfobulbus alkaliphilus]